MNTMPFSIRTAVVAAIGVLTLTISPPTLAEVKIKAKTQIEPVVHPELVLNLPDQWLPVDSANALTSHAGTERAAGRPQPRQLDVNCGMDENPLPTFDSSISNRLQGECNLGYHY